MKKVITHKEHNGSPKVYIINENTKHHIQNWESFELGCDLGLWSKEIENVPIDKTISEGKPFLINAGFKFQANPLNKMICTQKFGEWPDFYKKFKMNGHNGIDFRTKFDDSPDGKRPVYAVLDGIVNEAVSNENISGYGRYVRLKHKGESETIYAHFDSISVVKGQHVKAGDQIGISDNTGTGTGSHLHFGFRPKKSEVNYNNGYKGYIDCLDFFLGDINFK
jgi:murein DD-endopeptidase MepM/ murein hydrolase activator NlpD